jgi:hypothetical protein
MGDVLTSGVSCDVASRDGEVSTPTNRGDAELQRRTQREPSRMS